MLESIASRLAANPQRTLALLTIAILLPFVSKPFNMDDPLFIWAAHQIQAHPADPFGFNVEWYWREFPMWKVTENPPLAAYYIALAAGCIGWSEIALHLAFLLPALAAILGTFRLARHFCNMPMTAALAVLFTPAFLVSSTTIMCDVPMLAFWVWAVVFWTDGIEHNDPRRLFAAGCLIAFAEVTKYYGICLIPLLAAQGMVAKRRPGGWILFLLIPLAAACAYELVMRRLYGVAMFFGAVHYGMAKEGAHFAFALTVLIGLAFTGGSLAVVLFFTPLIWKRRAIFLTIPVLVIAVLLLGPWLFKTYPSLHGAVRMATQIQLAVWGAAGVSVLALVIADFKAHRNAKSFLLLLWVVGTFIFAVFLNWTINARSLLPMTPAVGILIARRLEQNPPSLRKLALCLAMSAALALSVTEADDLQAVAVWQNARSISAAYGQRMERIFFQGHWGFQYYMSALGARPLDYVHDTLKPGNLVAIPSNNTNVLPPAPGKAVLEEIYVQPGPPWMATVSDVLGANFYASVMGPLPFAFGAVPPETVSIYSLR
jgi:4-amino-4-deoxy-L-arabinose transferase-like glycosyltransferase